MDLSSISVTRTLFTADITYRFSEQAVNAKRKGNAKVVCLEWENIPFNYEEYDEVRKIKEHVRNGADHFIAVTERAKEALILEGVAEERIDVIPMGIDLGKFRPEREGISQVREEMGISAEERVILSVGRMVWEKGVYDFIHAAAKLIGDRALKDLPLKFLMVGKGPEVHGISERIARLGLEGKLQYIPEYSYGNMNRLYNLSDFLVLPSIPVRVWQEQFGMVLIECMACGRPVISTLSGSIPEVVGDAGILVQPNDHLSLYEAMKKLLTDEALYDSTNTASQVRAVFEKVLDREADRNSSRDGYVGSMELSDKGERLQGFEGMCRIFDEDPDNRDVLDQIISMGSELNLYSDIERRITEYLVFHPADLDLLVKHARCLKELGRYGEAEEQVKKVLIFDPHRESALQLLEGRHDAQSHVRSL
jgi:hypothetical protein